MRFLILSLILGLTLTSCKPDVKKEIVRATVMITNLSGTSGGSGSIIKSTPGGSFVLTNSHVCGLAERGALVHTELGLVVPVIEYRQSEEHDLCLIEVAQDLGVNTELAFKYPAIFEDVVVSGHPRLLPLIMTAGHLSHKQVIAVLIGIKKCTDEQLVNPETSMFCLLAGGLPIVKKYEAVVTSATIQPGSSGSSVYDSEGHITAVIFAGAGELGYGFAVPYEYVRNFITKEYSKLTPKHPNLLTIIGEDSVPTNQWSKNMKTICSAPASDDVAKICSLYENIYQSIPLSN